MPATNKLFTYASVRARVNVCARVCVPPILYKICYIYNVVNPYDVQESTTLYTEHSVKPSHVTVYEHFSVMFLCIYLLIIVLIACNFFLKSLELPIE